MASGKVHLTITYNKPGTQPPLFVAGTFSDPEWQPQEMEFASGDDGEHTFKKEVSVDAGAKVQYKFRVGRGDWWVLDENATTVTDDAGNRNNLLEAPSQKEYVAQSSTTHHNDETSSSMNFNKEEPGYFNGDNEHSQSAKNENGQAKSNGLLDMPLKPAQAEDEDVDLSKVPFKPEPEEEMLQPVANAAKEILSRSDPHSGASIPGYVKTSTEVADSAALLDKEDSEPEISDSEAGKIGFRRMSSTPIPEVAQTAAEVADSAQTLDIHEPTFEFELRPVAYNDFEDDGDIHGDHKPPLFSHECVGMAQGDGYEQINETENDAEYSHDRERTSSGVEYDMEKADLSDPTLEEFPSMRNDIINTVRKIETGLGEDQSVFEGVPPSPIVGPLRRSTNDILGDYYATSPVATSPHVSRSHERLRVSKSRGSNSSLSLQSISEAEEPDHDAEASSPEPAGLSPGKPKLKALITTDSDEDEGIAMQTGNGAKDRAGRESGYLTPEAAASPKPLIPQVLPEPVSDMPHPILETAVPVSTAAEEDLQDVDEIPKTPKTILAENNEHASPRIVLQPADEAQETAAVPRSAEADDDPDRSISSETETTATSSHLTKRVVPGGRSGSRPGTPASMGSAHLRVDQENWFRAFFRVLFDWIGDFISRLCGGR